MTGDLLGAALRRDVLCLRQLGAAALIGQGEEVVGYDGYRAAGASLPRRIGSRVDHNLTNDSPAIVVGVAARDEEARECLGNASRSWLGRVTVEVA